MSKLIFTILVLTFVLLQFALAQEKEIVFNLDNYYGQRTLSIRTDTIVGVELKMPDSVGYFYLSDKIVLGRLNVIAPLVYRDFRTTLRVNNTYGDSLKIDRLSGELYASNLKLKYFGYGSGILSGVIGGSTIRYLSLRGNQIEGINLSHNIIDTIDFYNSLFTKNSNINFANLPRVIDLTLVSVDSTARLLLDCPDLYRRRWYTKNRECKLFLAKADIDRIDFEYTPFKLDFDQTTQRNERIQIYKALLSKFEREHDTEGYERLSKHYKEFQYLETYGSTFGVVIDIIDWLWWDYGYGKHRVVGCSFVLYFLFVFINIFVYDNLVSKAYPLSKFIKIEREMKRKYIDRRLEYLFARFPYIMLYTGYIFWGIKLDKESINVRPLGLFVYVLFQYLVGVVCLAYIANYIITK